jgi:hypothetical protein
VQAINYLAGVFVTLQLGYFNYIGKKGDPDAIVVSA